MTHPQYISLAFTVFSDNGHKHNWMYSVRYTEKLSHWPHWTNEAVAHIAVKRVFADGKVAAAGDHPDGLRYVIESSHQTCFLRGLYCCKYCILLFKTLKYCKIIINALNSELGGHVRVRGTRHRNALS